MARFGRFLLFSLTAFVPAASGQTPGVTDAALRGEVLELRALVKQLEARVEVLERGTSAPPHGAALPAQAVVAPPAAATAVPDGTGPVAPGTTVNFGFDGYYGYNFNAPIGRANLLRAYDVSSNGFSINQANLVLENAPDPDHGKRFGARLDLQWGQATQTLQGNSANEPRPEIYRALFQAYGTYVAPIAKGITIDFGKWSSSIGMEGNYTKDQLNYSRSFWFNYLPFYHMGVRIGAKLSDSFTVNYWVTNGTQQTEAFNGYKDQMFGFLWQPTKTFNWTVNYYLGQEHPDVTYFPNGGAPPGAPTLQGAPFEPVPSPHKGKLHILDTYASWQAARKLQLAAETDWVIERDAVNSTPGETYGGAAYAQYSLTPKLALSGRYEYVRDRDGLYTGVPQTLNEGTLTASYKMGDGFLLRWEWRRDVSNRPYFYTDRLGVLANHQTTATVGLVWWFGAKQGVW
jgi:hypothetical protein